MGMRAGLSCVLYVLFGATLSSAQATSYDTSPTPATGPLTQVVLSSEVKWEQLNPLRGDKSPLAATLWGNRTGPGPAGFLLKPVDGFRSPPHIHNTAYRGVVIGGLFHNDDPAAEEMYMPAGSFWTQPAGGVHITAAKGRDILAYIEVEEAFGVLPADQAFRGADKPINVDASNVVWTDPPGAVAAVTGPKIAFLWGKPQDGQLNGTLVRLPAGFAGELRSSGSTFRAVVIQGSPELHGTKTKSLEPGSYFGATGASVHKLSCETAGACIIYVRMEGTLGIRPT